MTPAAARQRRRRQRQREGRRPITIAPVEVALIERLILIGDLAPERADDPNEVRRSLGNVLDRWLAEDE